MTPFRLDSQPFAVCDLVNAVRRLVPLLRERGVSASCVLAVQSGDPAHWVWLWGLARAADQPFMPLAPQLAAAEVDDLLHQAGGAVLLGAGCAARAAPELLAVTDAGSGHPIPSALHGGLIMQTSGSAGRPRGVMHSARGIAAASRAACRCLGFETNDLWLACLAPWHIGGVAVLERAMYRHARVLVLPKFEADRVWDSLLRHPVSHLSLVPPMLARLLEQAAGRRPPAYLRKVLVGGGALSPALAQEAIAQGWPLCVSYGLSEAGSQAATLCGLGDDWRGGDMGRPVTGMQLAIESSGDGHGRIKLRGDMLMLGYLNPEFAPGVGLLPDGWFVSSDLGRIDEAGHLHLLGRSDDMLVSGGTNVHPASVERVICRHPAVRDVVVLGQPDAIYGEIVTAIVVGSVDGEALLAWCREHLPSAQRPRRVILCDALPLGPTGKIDRRRLRELAPLSSSGVDGGA